MRTLKSFCYKLVHESIRFWMIVLPLTICCGCNKSINSPQDFEKLMDAKLPDKSVIQFTKNAADAGAIIIVHFSKTNFPAFSVSRVGYGQWNAITNQMDFEAAGKTFHAPIDLQGEYSVGKGSHGITQVLIWNEKSETLTALLSSGIM